MELTASLQTKLRSALTALRVVHAAFLVSLLLYWGVVHLTRRVGRIPAGRGAFWETDWLRYPLYILALATCLLLPWVQRRLLTRRALSGRTETATVEAMANATLLALVVAEVPAILGLALYFVGGYLLDFYLLAALSFLGLLMAFPREALWRDVLRGVASGASPAGGSGGG